MLAYCPRCRTQVALDDRRGGQSVQCMRCGHTFAAPMAPPPVAPPPAPFQASCPHCGASVMLNPRDSGQARSCPSCGRSFTAPAAPAAVGVGGVPAVAYLCRFCGFQGPMREEIPVWAIVLAVLLFPLGLLFLLAKQRRCPHCQAWQ